MFTALLPISPAAPGQNSCNQNTLPSRQFVALILAGMLAVACRAPAANPAAADLGLRTAALDAALDALAEPPAPDVLRVRLAFGAGADLDLYVTDLGRRGNETVYFARHTSRTGGKLVHDARCSDPSPRIDAAVFEAPLPEGVRIGVDYHTSCTAESRPEPFVVEAARGAQRERRRGIAIPGHFDDRFWMVGTGGDSLEDQYAPNVK